MTVRIPRFAWRLSEHALKILTAGVVDMNTKVHVLATYTPPQTNRFEHVGLCGEPQWS